MLKSKKRFIALFTVLAAVFAVIAAVLIAQPFRAYAEENDDFKIERLAEDSGVFKNGYLDRYGVPTEKFDYSNNGKAENGAPLSYAFDRNFGSIWRSEMQLKAGDASTVNNVEVEFHDPVIVDRILYQADSSWGNRGSFTKVRISYIPAGGSGYVALKELDYPQTYETNANMITFKSIQGAVKGFKIEWLGIHTGHRTCAAASEIIFLQPESDDVEKVQALFTDYAQLHLREDITERAQIEALREKVKTYATYASELSGLLTRAEQILDGKIVRDARREMATAPGSENLLTRHGDVAGYARSQLKMAWFGTNRQVTGVSATPDDVLTVYVEAEEDDPLPTLVCTQFWGAWSGWRSGEFKLSIGKNVIHPGNYNKDGYVTQHENNALRAGVQVPTGGPVYLVNPYEESAQSEHVKVYIEGGTLIPVFRQGGDVNRYKAQLAEYAGKVEAEWQSITGSQDGQDVLNGTPKIVDVTEIVSENIIVTVRASRANKAYNTGEEGALYDPQEVTDRWDEYVKELLRSDGVVLEQEKDGLYGGKYDPRARYLNCNIRLMQPFGAAYAHIEHVGIQVPWEMGALGAVSFGWGYTHELGHMMDIGERTVSECSNNMLSKYDETVMSKIAQRGDFDKTTAALAPDERETASFWNTNRGNFIFWWLIESFEIGYWPTLENLYRYEDIYKNFSEADKQTYGTVNATEKQVYLSSLAVKYDLSYYFERWGYNLSTGDPIFSRSTASKAFKKLMEDAKKQGRIEDKGYEPKIWYVDAAEWWARHDDSETATSIYTDADHPVLKAVTPCDEGNALLIDGGDKCLSPSHLGFEIVEGTGKNTRVVGFSESQTYIDTTVYPKDYIPVYSVVAYDRALTHSARSNELSAKESEPVCKIGQTPYYSLREAVAAAGSGDVITIVKDLYASAITIDKTVVIQTAGRHTVSKNGNCDLFNVTEGGSLTLKGTNGAQIVLDGSGIGQSGSLIRVEKSGKLTLEYCTLQNNVVLYKSATSALCLNMAEGGSADVRNTVFKQNSARLGGAVYSVSGPEPHFTACTFEDNEAEEGGALYARGTAMSFQDCVFKNNTSAVWGGAVAGCGGCVLAIKNTVFTDNVSVRGGAVYLDGSINMEGGSMTRNTATEEGAALLYNRTTTGGRVLSVKGNTEVKENVCESGAALYLRGIVNDLSVNVSAGSCLYAVSAPDAPGGSITFEGGSIAGAVFKGAEVKFTVRNSMFTSEEKVQVVLDTQDLDTEGAEPIVLFSAAGTMVFTDDEAQAVVTESGEVALSPESNEVVIVPETIKVVFAVGALNVEKEYLPGRKLTLDESVAAGITEELSGTRYIRKWTCGEETYDFAAEFIVTRAATLTADIGEKSKISYRFENGETDDYSEYVIPGETYALPSCELEQYTLNGWKSGGETFLPFASRVAEEGKEAVYTADTTKKFVVEYYIDRLDHTSKLLLGRRYYAFGEPIRYYTKFPNGANEEDYLGEGQEIGGFRIADGGNEIDMLTYTVVSDLKLDAIREDVPLPISYWITYGNHILSSENDNIRRGVEYTLAMRTIPYGYHISHMSLMTWFTQGSTIEVNELEFSTQDEIDGFKIDADDTVIGYVLDVEIEKNKYTVMYTLNGVETLKEERYYEDTIVLETPDQLPEKHHFVSYQVGQEELVLNEEGEYVTAVTMIDMQLGEDGTAEYVVTGNVVVNTVTYVEVEAQAEDPDDPDDPDNPDDPDDPENPDNPDKPDDPDNPDTPENPDNPDNPDTPDTPDTPDGPAQGGKEDGGADGGLPAGAIAGIAVGSAAVLGGAAAVAFILLRKRKH